MKCRVCGYEYDDSKLFCPMCGTKAPEIFVPDSDLEMNWNTRDFPRPRTGSEDVPMKWTNPDVSEGFVSVPETGRKTETEPVKNEKYYTIRASADNFQKLLDREYERLKALQHEEPERPQQPAATTFFRGFESGAPGTENVGIARPAKEHPSAAEKSQAFAIPSFLKKDENEEADEYLKKMILGREEPEAPQRRAAAPQEDGFDIDMLDSSIRQMQEEEDKAQKDSMARILRQRRVFKDMK